ncbi:DUF2127 domain-containing protein [Phormidium tenue FACHB-886]|nr:DUF2127 domain-containing protein [Phormidium tenue FACHB-886]
MTVQIQRSSGLKAIVAYKGLAVFTLIATSLASALSLRHYDALTTIAQTYLANQDYTHSHQVLETLLHLEPQALHLIAWLSGIYAIVLGTATAGLWYGKPWASVMMLIMAGAPLPIEVYEVVHSLSWQRLAILLLNLAVVGYLVRHRIASAQSLVQ